MEQSRAREHGGKPDFERAGREGVERTRHSLLRDTGLSILLAHPVNPLHHETGACGCLDGFDAVQQVLHACRYLDPRGRQAPISTAAPTASEGKDGNARRKAEKRGEREPPVDRRKRKAAHRHNHYTTRHLGQNMGQATFGERDIAHERCRERRLARLVEVPYRKRADMLRQTRPAFPRNAIPIRKAGVDRKALKEKPRDEQHPMTAQDAHKPSPRSPSTSAITMEATHANGASPTKSASEVKTMGLTSLPD